MQTASFQDSRISVLPTYQEFYSLILGHSATPQTTDDYLNIAKRIFNLTDDDLRLCYPSGLKILRDRMSWALSYLKNSGLLERPSRGVYILSQRGQNFHHEHPNGFTNRDLAKLEGFQTWKKTVRSRNLDCADQDTKNFLSFSDNANTTALTPDEQIESAIRALDGNLHAELLERILVKPPDFFERLVVSLLSKMGYGSEGSLAQAIGKSGDGGIDGFIHQDKLGLDVVYIQAKRYESQNAVGRPSLQAFVGSLAGHKATKGVFVTTSSFAKSAIDYLQTIPTRVVAIDGKRLVGLMIAHEVGTRVTQIVKISRIDEDFFLD